MLSPHTSPAQPDAPMPVGLPPALDDDLGARIELERLDLPLLPEAASAVLGLATAANCDLQEISKALHRDQALAGHVLRIANSAAFGGRSPITTLQEAVTRLGANRIRDVALIVACKTRIFNVPGFDHEIRQVFRHSVATGLYNQELAHARSWNPEEAFLCGLLHDIGWPVVVQAIVDLETELGLRCERAAILAAADHHHERVGAALARNWSLHLLSEIIRYHHHPHRSASPYTAMMTSVADALATLTMEENDPELLLALERHPGLATLDVTQEELSRLLTQREHVRSFVSVFS